MAEPASLVGDFDPKPTDRYFFALFPPAETLNALEARQTELIRMHGLSGKPTRRDRLHMTLCHLGDYVGENPDVVGRAVQAAVALQSKARPFEVRLDQAGSFAGRARNRPFVLKSAPGARALETFQLDLAAELQRAGLGKGVKSCTPHVTLAYDNQTIEEHPAPPVTWKVEEFALVRSLLSQSQHIRQGAWKLGG